MQNGIYHYKKSIMFDKFRESTSVIVQTCVLRVWLVIQQEADEALCV